MKSQVISVCQTKDQAQSAVNVCKRMQESGHPAAQRSGAFRIRPLKANGAQARKASDAVKFAAIFYPA